MRNKETFFFVLFSFLGSFVCAQNKNISVQYLVAENKHAEINSTKSFYNLIIKGVESIYYNNLSDSLNQFKYKDVISETQKIGEFTMVKLSDNNYEYVTQSLFYKNYVKDTLIFNEKIPFRTKVIIGENLHLFNWNIIPEKDSLILGYKCKSAVADFRGRTYIAYFCQELNSFGGPWKFDGLPGLILAVSSKDKYFIIEPVKISINTATEPIRNAYQNLKKEDILNWNQYKEKYEKRLKDIKKKLDSESTKGETISIKRTGGIEDLGIKEIGGKK